MCWPQVPLREHRADGYFEIPGGSQIWVGGLDDKERVEKILGNEYATILFNECSQIPFASVNTALTRLAQNIEGLTQRAYYDLNPVGKTHWTNLQFIQGIDPVTKLKLLRRQNYAHMFMNPKDNPHLSPEYLQSLKEMPERAKKRFYDGMYVDEIDGALWTLELIDAQRITREELPIMRRIVVAVDPSGAAHEDELQNDEIGIVVVGLGVDGNAYVLEDCSLRAGPGIWGKRAVKAFHDWRADRIIAEINYGGEMVRFVIQAADRNVPVKVITASRGKVVRAEPVSTLYEKKKVFHAGHFNKLEDQLCAFSTMGYTAEGSPDHADAAIWGLTELLLPQNPGGVNMIEYVKREAESQQVQAQKAREHPAAGVMAAAQKDGVKISDSTQHTIYDLRHKPAPAAAEPKGKARKGKKVKPGKKYSNFNDALRAQQGNQ